MKNMSALMALTVMGVMTSGYPDTDITDTRSEYIPYAPKDPVIPKGCKEYFFNIDGDYSIESMLKTETVFYCIASNNKVAVRKFNKWKSNK